MKRNTTIRYDNLRRLVRGGGGGGETVCVCVCVCGGGGVQCVCVCVWGGGSFSPHCSCGTARYGDNVQHGRKAGEDRPPTTCLSS